MEKVSGKEKYSICNTLNCVPVFLIEQIVYIDMRNETAVIGRIQNVDGFMNIHLVDAVFFDRKKRQYGFADFILRERMIRQIHIPAEIDVQSLAYACANSLRRPRMPAHNKGKRTYRQKRAQEAHQLALQEIERQKEEKKEQEKLAKEIQ